jgi:hypothetical protein
MDTNRHELRDVRHPFDRRAHAYQGKAAEGHRSPGRVARLRGGRAVTSVLGFGDGCSNRLPASSAFVVIPVHSWLKNRG